MDLFSLDLLLNLYCYKTCAFFLSSKKDLSGENTFILNSNINKKQNTINLSSSSDTYYRITSNRKPYEAIFSLGNVNLLIFGNSVMNGIFINDGGQHRWMVVSLRLGQQYYTSQDYSKTSFSFTSSGNGASVYISDGTIKTSASVKEYIYPLTTLIII